MKGSKTIAGFWLADCFGDPRARRAAGRAVRADRGGKLRPIVGGDYPLSDVASAHQDMRARRTVGKLVLDPTR